MLPHVGWNVSSGLEAGERSVDFSLALLVGVLPPLRCLHLRSLGLAQVL